MTIPPLQRTMISHHLAKYGSVLLNYWRKLGQLVMWEEGLKEWWIIIYQNHLLTTKKGDPLKWWHDNGRRYSLLENMAQRFLSAPPTSVPSERLFSGVGNLYSEKRNRLSPEHAEIFLSIKYNKHLVD